MPVPTMTNAGAPTPAEWDETRATARLPNLDVEIVHRRTWEGDAEQIQVTLQAVPPFEALCRGFEAANPLLIWTQMMQAAWAPWPALLTPPKRD